MNPIAAALKKAFAPGFESRKYRIIILVMLWLPGIYKMDIAIPEAVMLRFLEVVLIYIGIQGATDAVQRYRAKPKEKSWPGPSESSSH